MNELNQQRVLFGRRTNGKYRFAVGEQQPRLLIAQMRDRLWRLTARTGWIRSTNARRFDDAQRVLVDDEQRVRVAAVKFLVVEDSL